jgi:hypothetical protein
MEKDEKKRKEKKTNKRSYTSRSGYSSASSILTTWVILGLLSASGSTHLSATKRARFKARVVGLTSRFGSTTSSALLVPTIILSHSRRLTCHMQVMCTKEKLLEEKS